MAFHILVNSMFGGGAEIQAVCRRAALQAVREAVASTRAEAPVPDPRSEAGAAADRGSEKDFKVLIRREYLQAALEEVRENRAGR